MKQIAITIFLLICIHSVLYANELDMLPKMKAQIKQQNFSIVNSKSLELQDVVETAKSAISVKYGLDTRYSGYHLKLGGIYGIYQEGNSAKIFIELTYENKSGSSRKTIICNAYRLNSGAWFCPESSSFLIRPK